MEFVLLVGPQAVGKMAVGKKLAALRGLRLFHNHMTIELVIRLFPYSSKEAQYLIQHFRSEIFRCFVEARQGLIFTYLFAFDLESDWEYVTNLLHFFASAGAKTYVVELECTLEERLKRNKTEFRLQEKPSKKNLEWSERDLLQTMENHRLNSLPGEIKEKRYLRLDTTQLSEEEAAKRILSWMETCCKEEEG